MTEATDAQAPLPPEKLYKGPLTALQSRMLFAGSNLTQNINVINPTNVNVPEFTQEQITDINSRDYSLFNNASTNERKLQAGVKKEDLPAAVQAWAAKCTDVLHKDARAEKLQRMLGIDPKQITTEYMLSVYQAFFGGQNNESNIQLFVKNVVAKYTTDGKVDRQALEGDLNSIQWFTRIFGKTSAEIVTQLIDAEVKLIDNPEEFIRQGNESRNTLTADDTRLLTFLWENRTITKPEPKPDTTQPEPDETGPQQEQPPGEKTLEERFRIVVGKPNPENKSLKANYFFTSEPKNVQIDQNTYQDYEIADAFFLTDTDENNRETYVPNSKVVPYYYDLASDTLEKYQKKPNYEPDARFINAEESTNGDSSFFALTAASATTPENQAKLYRLLSNYILDIHDKKSDLKIRWLEGQGKYIPEERNSLYLIHYYDHIEGTDELVPKIEDRMLAYKEDGTLGSEEDFQKLWKTRETELKQALAANKIPPHHLRWLEFLSHSVNVDKLIKDIRSRQPTPSEQKPSEEIVMHPIDVERNVKAAERFIEVLRAPAKFSDHPLVKTALQHEYGFVVDQPPGTQMTKQELPENGWFYTNANPFNARYQCPLGLYNSGGHAYLILEGPRQRSDGKVNIKVYNPMKTGTQLIDLPDFDFNRRNDPNYVRFDYFKGVFKQKTGGDIDVNNLWWTDYSNGEEILLSPDDEEFKPYFETLFKGKLAKLQEDAKNCTLYSNFVGALLNALKPGDTAFKTNGLKQFQKDFGIKKILTREEILNALKSQKDSGVSTNTLNKNQEYAQKFWDRNKDTKGLRESMTEEITREAKKGEFIKYVNETGITENDKEKLAAYQSLARELGYQIGEFTIDPKTGKAIAKITPIKDEVPAGTHGG